MGAVLLLVLCLCSVTPSILCATTSADPTTLPADGLLTTHVYTELSSNEANNAIVTFWIVVGASLTQIISNGRLINSMNGMVTMENYATSNSNRNIDFDLTVQRCITDSGEFIIRTRVQFPPPVRPQNVNNRITIQETSPSCVVLLSGDETALTCPADGESPQEIEVNGDTSIGCVCRDYYPSAATTVTINTNTYTAESENITQDTDTCMFNSSVTTDYTVTESENATFTCGVGANMCTATLYRQQIVTDPDDGTTTPRTEWSTRRASGPSTTPGDDDDCKVGSMKCWEFAVMIIVLGLVTIVVLVLVCVLCKRTKKKQKVEDSESAKRNQRQKPNDIEMHNDDEVEEPEGDSEEEEGMRGGAAIVVNENEKDKQKSKTKKDKKTDSKQEKRKKKKQKKDKKGEKGKEPNDEQPQYVNQGSYMHDENADENNVTDDASHDQAMPNVSGKDKPPRTLPPIKHTPMQNL